MEEIADAIGQAACLAIGNFVAQCQMEDSVPLLGFLVGGTVLVLGAIWAAAVLRS